MSRKVTLVAVGLALIIIIEISALSLIQGDFYFIPCPKCSTATCALWFSTISIILFFLFYASAYAFESFTLRVNPWIMKVKHMSLGFNPMYFTWLFGRDRKRWAKWINLICLVFASVFGGMFVWIIAHPGYSTSWDNFQSGCFFGSLSTILLAFANYQRYRKQAGRKPYSQ